MESLDSAAVEGGSSQIALRMKKKVKAQIAFELGKAVTAIFYKDGTDKKKVDVTVEGEGGGSNIRRRLQLGQLPLQLSSTCNSKA